MTDAPVSNQAIRDLALALLKYERDGVGAATYEILYPILVAIDALDILARVKAVDGRFYIPCE